MPEPVRLGLLVWPALVLLRNAAGPVRPGPALLRLLPDWRLFAPTPIDFDIDVWIREVDAAGRASEPRRLRWRRRPGLRLPVLNPESRIDKVVYDLSRQLLDAAGGDLSRIESTAPFHALSTVALRSAAPGCRAQFAIAKRTRGVSQTMFCSTWQGPLEAVGAVP